MTRIIDLDESLPENVGVRLGGVVYELPGDIPIPDYLAITKAADALDTAAGEDALERLDDLYQRILALFQVHNPDLDKLPLGVASLVRLIQRLYGVEDAADPQKPADKPAAGTRNTSRKTTKRKSASSA